MTDSRAACYCINLPRLKVTAPPAMRFEVRRCFEIHEPVRPWKYVSKEPLVCTCAL